MQKNEIILYQPDDTVKLEVRSKIQIIRGTAVMIDRDLAVLYSVDTKRINEQARRNIERFPDRFRFQLTNEETSQLVAFCDRFKALKHSTVNPFAYTEQGVAMLATVLKSETAVKVSIGIMDAFVEMHRLLESTAGLSQRIESLEYRQLKTDHRINELFQFIETMTRPPKKASSSTGKSSMPTPLRQTFPERFGQKIVRVFQNGCSRGMVGTVIFTYSPPTSAGN